MFEQLEKIIKKEVSFSADFWEELKNCAENIYIKKNEHLIHQGEVCRYGYFLNRGSLIHYFQSENGKETVLSFYVDHYYQFLSSPLSYFNEIGSTFEIKALEDCKLIAFHKDNLEKLSQKYPDFAVFYHKITATALHNMYLYTAMRLSLSAEDFLIYLMKNMSAIFERIPDKYIAQFVGVSGEWLCKVKKKILITNNI
ncbi:Crp/Fnr family transcriptional regulator [Carboxylicivirga caseinilyticus]|uniref:Crp/Fnr family transcriptional regulator n=1 Tax=Carboxylicivirga caseinilyticus TaxID=3417572 RepID=UPI003D32EBBC|nr:Crp/Fnr family transcriptional regulator [Marinilabiliaceae bacterium A049]